MRPRVAGVERTLQECNEITVKHMILLHVSVMISHVNMYGTHVLWCEAFLIWLILYKIKHKQTIHYKVRHEHRNIYFGLRPLARIALPWPQTWLGSGLSEHKCQLLPLILTFCGLQQVERLDGKMSLGPPPPPPPNSHRFLQPMEHRSTPAQNI